MNLSRIFFCPCNTHPKGNEYHTICFGESNIRYIWDIVEGRDNIVPIGINDFKTFPNMKKFGIML